MKNIWNDPRSLFNGNHFSSLGHFDYVHIRMNTFVRLRQTTSYVILMFPLFE